MRLRTAIPSVALSLASVVPALGPVIQQCGPPPPQVTYAGQLPGSNWLERWWETISNAFRNAAGQIVPGTLRPPTIRVTKGPLRTYEVHSCWLNMDLPGTTGGDVKLVPLDPFWKGKAALYNEQCVQPVRLARAAGRNVSLPVVWSYEGTNPALRPKDGYYHPIQMRTPVSDVAGFAQGLGVPWYTVATDAYIVSAYYRVIPTF